MKPFKIIASVLLISVFIFNVIFSLPNCAFSAPDVFFKNEETEIAPKDKTYSRGPITKEIVGMQKSLSKNIYKAIENGNLNKIEKLVDNELSKKEYINAIFIKLTGQNIYKAPEKIGSDDEKNDFLYAKLKPDYKNIVEYEKRYFDFISGLYMRKYYITDKKNNVVAIIFLYVVFNDK